MLTKEKCKEALVFLWDEAAQECELDEDSCELIYIDRTQHEKYLNPYIMLEQLIEEHFELKRKFKKSVLRYDALLEEYGKFRWNPPLKFEELKENMWVWDNFLKRYFQIWRISEESDIFYYTDNYYNGAYKFEENRLFRKQVDE